MKRIFCFFCTFIIIFQFSCRTASELEKLIHRPYKAGEEKSKKDNAYLISKISDEDILYSLTTNLEITKEDLAKKLDALEHTEFRCDYHKYIWVECQIICDKAEAISKLMPRQLLRINLLLDFLEKEKIIQEIGKQIRQDLKDKYAEHGGIVLFNGKDVFHTIPSSYPRTHDNNGNYRIPEQIFRPPHITEYHFHALQKKDNLIGPSYRDIEYSLNKIDIHGESHDLVIASLVNRKFNVVYYGGEKNAQGVPIIIILALGNYSY